MVVRLQREVERMESAVPLLKYVGGEILSLDHWQELFHMLELPRETKMEQLTFGEVLGASDIIVQRAQELKVRVRGAFCLQRQYNCNVISEVGTESLSWNQLFCVSYEDNMITLSRRWLLNYQLLH